MSEGDGESGPVMAGAESEALVRREAQIEALLEAVPDALFAVDRHWRITLMNRPAEAFLHRSREDVAGRVLWDVFPDALGTPTEGLLRATMDGEDHGSIELESVTRPGRFVNLRLTRKATGGLAILFTDITDQRATRAREKEQSEDFRALADNIPALCWMTYHDGHVYWFNSRWYDYTGMSPDTQIGWGWASVHDPDVLPAVEERWRASLGTGEPFEMIFPLKRRDGVFLPFLVRAVPVRNGEGAIIRWFGSCTDIADQIRQQQRLRTMVDELNHRVKNTLATIQSLASNSLRKAPDVDTGYRAFEARLMTLSAAHNILAEEKWTGADLASLLTGALAPFSTLRDGQASILGPKVWLSPRAALDISLIVHELTINAAKCGGLSQDGGTVDLSWAWVGPENDALLRLHWAERGGPPVSDPSKTGFGTRLIKRIARDEGGMAEFAFDPDGLTCTVTLHLQDVGEPLQL